MNAPASLGWLVRHEMSLSWRDFVMMLTAGRPRRQLVVAAVIALALVILHFIAWLVLRPGAESSTDPAGRMLVLTGLVALAFSLMGSQAMESITRLFYTRSDLDLILSSPVSSRRVFAVRIGAVAASATVLSVLLAAPAINVMALRESPRWLLAYPFALSLGVVATVMALALTLLLFRFIGPRRTRTVAQIAAALIGGLFIIGIQLAAIASIGTVSRLSFLQSEAVRAWAPQAGSAIWLPARAAMGEVAVLAGFALASIAAFAGAVYGFAEGLAEKVIAAAGISQSRSGPRRSRSMSGHRSVAAALRGKEWILLARDHWLISQTLMQVLYLAPPAFLLWRAFGHGGAVPTVIVPVLVMAAGQLAGGLAWLAISGEDAPQLVATAPVRRSAIVRAKAEAVMGVIAVLFAPIIVALAWFEPRLAVIVSVSIVLAAVSATTIQLWFRSQARRSDFRRRQTSSRVATFAEAFSSIFWAGSAALWAGSTAYSLLFAGLAVTVLAIAWTVSPNRSHEY